MVKKPAERRGQWLRGIEAMQCGMHAEAFACFVAEGEGCETAQRWARAAIAWRTAASAAGRLGDPARSADLLRRSAQASLLWAETSDDPRQMREGFLEATRALLAVGDLPAAKHALDLAVSLESTLADDPAPLAPGTPTCASA